MKGLQYGFSSAYSDAAYSVAGRERKARKVLAILEEASGPLAGKSMLDIGCSAGIMTRLFAPSFASVVGTDIDMPALEHARKADEFASVSWVVADSQRLPFDDETFDVVNCAHIYEHVPDANLLMSEIHRVLRANGVCFFSAGNRLSYMEPHYHIPLLSVVPKFVAHRYLRILGRGKHYYETHFTYWGLRQLVRRFDFEDYTLRVVGEPHKYFADDMISPGSTKQRWVLRLLKVAIWICPTYLWVLRKPAPSN